MKIATVSRKSTPMPRHPPAPASDGQDIPVLGVSLAPRQSPDWPALLREGVQPALVLGAERRLQGRR
jgi:hypothetical protein